ncbi:exopolyphosphatase [Bermanella marisrubri]|uniref:Exopolyphosphatase n=1 Tax=Bermanella marisrubri TaxID=207949 RepID=Q1N4E2_9GAMM|nr:exopolyphosphatase [Bermanella marisrubri]EAT12923.1 Exopolyphosphatase [Oceanobacter sp. RED65] [Bermanella marisrubri]QIZ82946.1 exopolyphosphatase [Bermanella marisrubri]
MEQSVQAQTRLAAIDLGSNSFHMVVARVVNGQIQVIDKRGEKVQLAQGLDPKQGISEAAQERALACLERFGQHLRGIPRSHVTVLGTNTLRAAKNSRAFMQKANEMLGFPIEVISGIEEARLVYLGVAHTLADDEGKRLVIDIGGGSTEFIIGERFAPIELESLHMGCVTFSDRYFSNGELTEDNFRRAINAAQSELLSIQSRYQRLGWQNVVGSSGTMRATSRVLQNYGLTDGEVTLEGLIGLKKIILKAKHVNDLSLQGINDQRLQVYPAGLAILIAIFQSLRIETLTYSDGALREGALYDLIGRNTHEDVREKTVDAMQARFVVDIEQAENVKTTALKLLEQCAKSWKLNEPEYEEWLRWSADLHEVGLAIAHNSYHKHGAYLIRYSDMHGFSNQTQYNISLLVRSHRRKFPVSDYDYLPKRGRNILIRIAILLRLAVLLHHGRGIEDVVEPQIEAKKYQIKLTFPEGYLENHPMTSLDLDSEKQYLDGFGYNLIVNS